MRSSGFASAVALAVIVSVSACDSDGETGGPEAADAGPFVPPEGGSSTDSGSSDSGTDSGTVTPGGDTAIVQLAAGRYSACARRKNGVVWCWGRNDFGELGRGTFGADPGAPAPVTGLTDASDIAVGDGHACAVHASGAVSCWGVNAFAQLGDGTAEPTTKHLTPFPVRDMAAGAPFADGVTIHAAFDGFNCIRRTSGAVVCWSAQNNVGQTGDGANDSRIAPGANVTGITGALEVVKGDGHGCARLAAGVSCWGADFDGQLGDGASAVVRTTPVSAIVITDAVELSAGQGFTCWRHTDGTVSCVGKNHVGQLGNGTKNDVANPTASLVSGLTDAKQISSSQNISCAVRTSGKVSCWGHNAFGGLGDGTKTITLSPVEVVGLTDATQVTVGENFGCALRATGQVVCWGSNNYNQVADGARTERLTPVPVAL